MITQELQEKIRKDLVQRLKDKIANYDFTQNSGNPFIDIVFGKHSNMKSFIHGTATNLGSYYETLAREIAKENQEFSEVKKFEYKEQISDPEGILIRVIIEKLEAKQIRADYDEHVLAIFNEESKPLWEIKITIDLYLKKKTGEEYYVEMKGPDPNKKEVRAAKEDLMRVVAMKKREMTYENFQKNVRTVFGVYYNNNDGEYKNWKVSPMFERGKDLLVQEEFWDLIGGEGTYDVLLRILEKVREDLKTTLDAVFEENF